jgi:hypothetical protein
VVDPTNQFITYTPGPGFTTDSFQYKVSDGNGGFDVAFVNVGPVGGGGSGNEPPMASDDFVYDVVGPVDIEVLLNDSDFEIDPLQVIHVSTPNSGTAQIGANGQYVTYTPDAGFTGDSFQYTITDGQGNSASAKVWLYAPPGTPPGGGGELGGGGGFGGSFPPSGDPDVRTDVTAFDIAQAMTVDTSILQRGVRHAPPTGRPVAVATANLTWYPLDGYDYGVLTSGDAALINDPGVFSTNALGGNQVRGDTDYDVTTLRVDFVVSSAWTVWSFDLSSCPRNGQSTSVPVQRRLPRRTRSIDLDDDGQ